MSKSLYCMTMALLLTVLGGCLAVTPHPMVYADKVTVVIQPHKLTYHIGVEGLIRQDSPDKVRLQFNIYHRKPFGFDGFWGPGKDTDFYHYAKHPIAVEYRVRWFDANGMEISNLTNTWKSMTLPLDETETVGLTAGVSPDTLARIEIRPLTLYGN